MGLGAAHPHSATDGDVKYDAVDVERRLVYVEGRIRVKLCEAGPYGKLYCTVTGEPHK